MLEHGDPLDPHPEGEALDLLRVIAVLAHVLEDVGVDHPGAQNLDPRRAFAQRATLAVGGDAVDAVEAGDVDLDARLGEGEEMRSQPNLTLLTEDRPGEGQQRALEVCHRDVGVDGEALDLVKLGRVGGVGIRAVDPSGHDDVDRRGLLLHCPDLHRRGVYAQEDRLRVEQVRCRLDVERVGGQPRWMGDRRVERIEVVVDAFDLRPLGDVEPEPDEDVFDLSPCLGDQM